MIDPANELMESALECALEIPGVVAKACEGLPPGVIILNITEALQELVKIINRP